MKNKTLLIVADLGLLRAYRVTQNDADRQPHLELVEESKPESAHGKLSDQVTDQAGRFPKGGGSASIPGNLAAGENLNAEGEQERQLIKEMAGRIDALLIDKAVTRCSIALSGAIHNQVLEAIAPEARAKIGEVLASNLAKTPPSELPSHFQRPLL
ncbi:MAG: host attachment protein [Verrucomicrobiales bacterium]|jgi:hypothetical protein|nr:host attachment protein [Verrucomicrobiales bacterium]HQZ29746.1 host attachment protein [Verrucomicrobiales bacterium]